MKGTMPPAATEDRTAEAKGEFSAQEKTNLDDEAGGRILISGREMEDGE